MDKDNIFKRLLSWLNIHPDENQKWILASTISSGLIMTYIGPIIIETLIESLHSEWVSVSSLVSSTAGFLIGVSWKKGVRQKAIKKFLFLAVGESICGLILGLYLAFIDWNIWVFAICSLMYSALFTKFVSKCQMAFRSVLWVERDREIYDNNQAIIAGIICITGYSLSLIAKPNLKFALILWSISCILDDFGWIVVYLKNKNALKQLN